MKKQILKKIFFAFFILTLGSCRDPIFFTISQEEKQLEPLIKGSPTNFVEFNNKMYVGSGKTLYRYDGQYPNNPARGNWTLSTPGGNIRQLAETGSKMYALCGEPGNFILKESSDGSNWSNVAHAGITVQAIYSANDKLFVGTGQIGALSIYYYDGTFTNLAYTQDKLLNGAAHDGTTYYLSVKSLSTELGGGIYTSGSTPAQTNTSLIGNSNNIPFMGVIKLGTSSNIVAISRKEGVLYTVTSSGVTNTNRKLGTRKLATGALLVFNDNLLLAGRQDEMLNSINYEHGYRELVLSSGSITGTDFLDPGTHSPSTVDNYATYRSTLEKNPVKHLFKASYDDKTLFASTYTNGVWSYRLRDGRWQWNSEQ
jgi:hypothetical protein